LRVGDGAPSVKEDARESMLSTARTCPACATGVPELDPRWFSFNTKQGRCEHCEGTGVEGGPEAVEVEGPHEVCSACAGTRLSALPRGVRLHGATYAATTSRSVASALERARAWRFEGSDAEIARAPHAELLRRLAFVEEVGLGYLALSTVPPRRSPAARCSASA
jgi:excinuclease ABC subunit A